MQFLNKLPSNLINVSTLRQQRRTIVETLQKTEEKCHNWLYYNVKLYFHYVDLH